jgi:hypothetical protein
MYSEDLTNCTSAGVPNDGTTVVAATKEIVAVFTPLYRKHGTSVFMEFMLHNTMLTPYACHTIVATRS